MSNNRWIKQLGYLLFLANMLCLSSLAVSDELETTLVIRGEGESFSEVLNGMTQDLEGELSFDILVVGGDTTVKEVSNRIKKTSPKAIVLMGNKAINLYQKYQSLDPGQDFPPSILLVALYIDQHVKNIKNSTGILYEIPAVTALINLRKVIDGDIKRVGVIHREWMKDYINTNIQYCQTEDIELIPAEVSNDNDTESTEKSIKKHLKKFKKTDIDALWVINDSQLLTPELFSKAWLPSLKKMNIPVVVGVESLLSSRLNFGTFAVVPDHYSLGVQGASILADTMEAGWVLKNIHIDPAISVKKIINLNISKNKKIHIIEKSLDNIDSVIQQ